MFDFLMGDEKKDEKKPSAETPAPPEASMPALEDAINSADVVFFNNPTCPFCRQAESALKAEGIDFTMLPIAEYREALKVKTGKTSAPSVWIKGTYIGGCNDGTEPWHGVRPCIQSGKIKELLEDGEQTGAQDADESAAAAAEPQAEPEEAAAAEPEEDAGAEAAQDEVGEEAPIKRRPVSDLKVGETWEGTLVSRSRFSYFVDIGFKKDGLVWAPTEEMKQLKIKQAVNVTVEKVDLEAGQAGLFYVSIDGLPKLKPLEDFKEGDVVDGRVARKSTQGSFINIGAEKDALLRGNKTDAFKLERNEELKGLRIEVVDLEKKQLVVSFEGLSELVSSRPTQPRKKRITPKKDAEAAPKPETKPKQVAKSAEASPEPAKPKLRLDGRTLTLTPAGGSEDGAAAAGSAPAGAKKAKANKKKKTKPAQDGKAMSAPKKPLAELEVGATLEGTIRKAGSGFAIDLGYERGGFALAPRKELADRFTSGQRAVAATVESVDLEAGTFDVTIAGLPKPRLVEELEEGEMVDGIVCYRSSKGVFIDIGSERGVLLTGNRGEMMKLEPSEELKGLTVKKVDAEKRTALLSFAGLSDLVSGRSSRRPPADDDEATPGDVPPADVEDGEATPVKRPLTDMKVGETLEGKVVFVTRRGDVLVDVGCKTRALALALRKDRVKLKRGQAVNATVEKVNAEADRLSVSIAGLPKPRLLEDLEVGATVDGYVATRNSAGIFLDIGYESEVLLYANMTAKRTDAFKLEPKEELKGLKVEKVDLDKGNVGVSFAGLSDLVSDRPELPPPKARE